jgi:hypothetical protein
MNPENLRRPFPKDNLAIPAAGRKNPGGHGSKSDRVELVLREQLLRIALDRRVKVAVRVRFSQYLLDLWAPAIMKLAAAAGTCFAFTASLQCRHNDII